MQSLPSIAATLKGAAASPVPPTLASTGGLFEREVERAVERDGGERALETRAASQVQERRSARQASFEHVREEETPARREGREHDPVQALAEPARPAPVAAEPSGREDAPSGRTPGGNDAGGRGSASAPAAQQAAAPGALPAVAPSGVPAALPGAVAGTPGAAAAAALAPVADASAPAGAAQPADGATTAFLHGARGRGPSAGSPTHGAGEAPDAALIDRAAEVLRQIKLSLSPSARRIVVDLQPEELGRLSIRMDLRHGRVSAVVRAESPQTLELLDRHLPELRAVLADRGIDTGSLELELGFGGAAHGGHQESAAARRAWRPNGTRTPAVSAIDAEILRPATWTPSVEGGVDTYA